MAEKRLPLGVVTLTRLLSKQDVESISQSSPSIKSVFLVNMFSSISRYSSILNAYGRQE